ncbi:aspartate/glutamate racemase family protein [Brevibacillus ginsengisoli]|uniref:aspartate/glutamate racemase family protein n=1 Tax=Brevibacillus ginsengisoli TaxID=363854 RepID=UPI003CEDA258
MKTIGLIGGMSWESSLEYYRIMNEKVKEELGGYHSAKCLMYSVNFEEVKQLQFCGNWEAATELMIQAAEQVERGGADCLMICTNTMHMMADEVQANIRIPLIHIADATGEQIQAHQLRKVGLLGTRFTMEQEFYRKRLFDKYGIEVIIPEEADRETVHRIIYDELILGKIEPASKEAYKTIMQKLIDQGAEGIVLGCTEIMLLINQADCRFPIFDTTRIHAEAGVAFSLQKQEVVQGI